MNNKYNEKVNKKSGFTLIEVMVSVTLFAIVMTMSLGAILSIIDGNKKAQAINSVANNLNFAVESMVRDIKTGYAYNCTGAIPVPETSSNLDSNNSCGNLQDNISLVSTITGQKRGVKYFLKKDDGKGRIYKVTSDNNTIEYPVTSPEVDVQTLNFKVNNPPSNDYSGQPSVFLIIKGTANVNPNEVSDFSIQTLISQRNLNLPK